VDEFVVADDMRHRKSELERRASVFVILPGGIGTLEEFFEMLVGRFLGLHDKPIVLVNTAGFYDPLLEMMRRGIETGFVRPAAWELVEVVDDVPAAVTRLEEIARD
ncbi:MAG: TIGR00730 family Rossman fold protein, partial [Planctomycetota bacterium]